MILQPRTETYIVLLVKWSMHLNMIIIIEENIYAFVWCMIPVQSCVFMGDWAEREEEIM